MLNEYLAQMQGPIDHFGGFIDKFIGDAIMALFDQEELRPGRGGSQGRHRHAATAVGMEPRTPGIDQRPVRFGHRDPYRHGDARISAVPRAWTPQSSATRSISPRKSKNSPSNTVPGYLSAATPGHSSTGPGLLRELDLVAVKGRTAPIAIHELFQDLEGEPLIARAGWPKPSPPRWRCIAGAHGQMLSRDSSPVWNWLRAMLPSALILKRSDHFRNDPPPDDWNGSFIMDSK